ncbi:putative ABC transporter-binding protein [Abditibacteriota bacterium]|nr:putative ABC transporter-binding protein [Abditibacteriota bacterium]
MGAVNKRPLTLALVAWLASSSSAVPAQVKANAQQGKIIEPRSKPGKYGGTITDINFGSPKTFNLWVSADASSSNAVSSLYSSLNEQNAYTLEWAPALAELPQVSRDGLTWTFRLKDGLSWSDGQPLTADDVLFTLKVIYDPKVETNWREGMLLDVPNGKGGFKRVPVSYQKLDRRTVQFKFPFPYAPARSLLSFPIAPRHMLEAAWKQGQPNSTDFNRMWGDGVNVKEMVSSGPWIITQYRTGARLVYSRNPYYWKKDAWGRRLPYLDHYISLFAPDYASATLALMNGKIDVTSVRQDDYQLLKRGESKGNYKVYNLGSSFSSSYLSFNLNRNSKPARANPELVELFNDVRFRQAVSHAIDRNRIVREVYGGLAKPAYGPESPANKLFYTPNIPKFEFNLAAARQKLAAIGLRDKDGDGFLNLSGGQPLRFTLLTNVENGLCKETATIIAADLRKIGLDVTFTPIGFNDLISRLDDYPTAGAPAFDWQAIILGFTGTAEPNDGRNIWMSSGNLHQWDPDQKKPHRPWEAQIDELLRRGVKEMNPSRRRVIYEQLQKIVAQEQPLIYTVVPESIAAIRNKYGNVKPTPLGGLVWNVEDLYDLKATRNKP